MKKLLANLLQFSLVGFLPYLVNFLVLPLYGNYIDSSGFGVIGLAMAAVAIGASWTGIQLGAALARFYFSYHEDELKIYVSTIFISLVVISGVFFSIYLIIGFLVVELFDESSISKEIILYTALLIFMSVLNTFVERLLINEGSGRKMLTRAVLSQFFSVLIGIYLILYKDAGVDGYFISIIFYYVMMVAYSLFETRRYFVLRFKYEYLLESLKYSVPLVAHALGSVAFMYSTVFFINGALSISLVGVFFICERFSQIVKAIVNSVNNVLMPIYNRLSEIDVRDGVRFLECVVPIWFLLIATLVVNFSFLAQAFLDQYMGDEYAGVTYVLLALVASYIFRGLYCFSTAPLFFLKKTKVIPKITVLTGFFTLLANFVLVPWFELFGAAIAVFLSFLFNYLMSVFYRDRNVEITFMPKLLLKVLIYVLLINVPIQILIEGMDFILALCVSVALFTVTLASAFYLNLFKLKKSLLTVQELL